MTHVTIEEAQQSLSELIRKAAQGEEVILLSDKRPIARLTSIPPNEGIPKRGSGKDLILFMSPDFDAPLEDFEEYMR